MSERNDIDFLRDIQEAARRIQTYCQEADAMTYHRFLADTKTQDAVVRNLEIIGEATRLFRNSPGVIVLSPPAT
jgi:uncharacterized protein with HEPN domain